MRVHHTSLKCGAVPLRTCTIHLANKKIRRKGVSIAFCIAVAVIVFERFSKYHGYAFQSPL
jgi:hypothetical protein